MLVYVGAEFMKLSVFDPTDEDTYMLPPVDVRYEEPLWLTRLLEVRPMEIDVGKYHYFYSYRLQYMHIF